LPPRSHRLPSPAVLPGSVPVYTSPKEQAMIRRSHAGRFTLMLLVPLSVAVDAPIHAQTFSVLYNFNNTGDPTGFVKPGALAQGRDGNVYTTSVSGGNGNPANGTVFTITTAGELSELHAFTEDPDGCNPYSGVTLGTDGNFYGAVLGCGTIGYGFVFKITPSGNLMPLYNFTEGSDGGNPSSTPVEGNDGNFYVCLAN
jgi:hypothetical protein